MALEIPSGSITLMHVNTAPPGWVKTDTNNDHILRLVTGSAGSGGTVDFSSFAVTYATTITATTRTISSVTLTGAELPYHRHQYNRAFDSSSVKANTTPPVTRTVMRADTAITNRTSGSNGSSVAHIHSLAPGVTFSPDGDLDMRVKYVDVLLVQRL